MQEKRTLYLAGKITGDPYYFTKFYNATRKRSWRKAASSS